MAKSNKNITSSDAGKDNSFLSGTDLSPTYQDVSWTSEDWDNFFKGTDYWQLYQANPYANMTFEQTFWDKIGLSNKYDDNVLANQKAYNEYNASLAQKMYDEQKNSYSTQVSEMKSAGLNPDLTGAPASAGGASPQSPTSTPNFQSTNPMEQIQGAIGIVTTALGFVQTAFQNQLNLDSVRLSNQIKEFQLFDASDGMARSFAFGGEFPQSISSHDVDSFLESIIPLSGVKGRKAQKYLKQNVSNLIFSPQYESEFYRHKRQTSDDRFSYNSNRSSKFFDEDDDYMMIALKGLRELQDLLLSDDINTRTSENKSKRDYNTSFTGSERGSRDKENALYDQAVNRVMGTMMSKAYDKAIHGDLGSQLWYIFMLRLLGGFK